MTRLLRLSLAALFLAAPALLAMTPRPAHAFCINCDVVDVIEYVNEISGHYLLVPLHDPEAAIVDGGGAGPGWQRTGNNFSTLTYAALPVCRFYSPVYNTHFYTADAAECASVKRDPHWIYEKSPFGAIAPVNGSCTGAPIYRVTRVGDHRYTADKGLRDGMLAKGWIDEGIGFCASGGGLAPILALSAPYPLRLDSAQSCQASAGGCVALDSLAPMPNRVPPYLPPNYLVVNPAYPAGTDTMTGYIGSFDLYTSQPADPGTILQHSFATLLGSVYINGRDRTSGDYAAISPMFELAGVAGATGDERVFPWRPATDRELRVSAYANVGVVARDGPGSHAYGGPLLEFGDASSGHSFRVTILAYGTQQPGDFVAPDARTGEPIVSTVFRPSPMFGRVVSGSFIDCSTSSPCAPWIPSVGERVPFTFGMKRADFQAALDRARTLDAALSANPADYFLARVEFHNETYLDARLGATIFQLTAEVWYAQ